MTDPIRHVGVSAGRNKVCHSCGVVYDIAAFLSLGPKQSSWFWMCGECAVKLAQEILSIDWSDTHPVQPSPGPMPETSVADHLARVGLLIGQFCGETPDQVIERMKQDNANAEEPKWPAELIEATERLVADTKALEAMAK